MTFSLQQGDPLSRNLLLGFRYCLISYRPGTWRYRIFPELLKFRIQNGFQNKRHFSTVNMQLYENKAVKAYMQLSSREEKFELPRNSTFGSVTSCPHQKGCKLVCERIYCEWKAVTNYKAQVPMKPAQIRARTDMKEVRWKKRCSF